jgi:hypothetical protein
MSDVSPQSRPRGQNQPARTYRDLGNKFSRRVTIRARERSKFSQRRSRAMQRLEHAGGLLVGGEGFEANAPPFNDKAGNFAGIGENGRHAGPSDNSAEGNEWVH